MFGIARFCIYHAQVREKGISPEDFSRLINEQFENRDYNFEGYVFSCFADFHGRVFEGPANFQGAVFEGSGQLKDWPTKELPFSQPEHSCADFRNTTFKGDANFSKAKFSGGTVSFQEALFLGTQARFDDAFFDADKVAFTETVFKGLYAGFTGVNFSRALVSFYNTTFDNQETSFSKTLFGEVYFSHTHFRSSRTLFVDARFEGETQFYRTEVRNEVLFLDLQIPTDTNFYFKEPLLSVEVGSLPRVLFSGIEFKPFATFFEMLPRRDENEPLAKPRIPAFLFRYCQLKDVYFTDNQLDFISFYKSSFDEAHFVSGLWGEFEERLLGMRFKRKNIIGDELLKRCSFKAYESGQVNWRSEYDIGDYFDYNEVAVLYRRFKTTLDKAKDYQRAGWLYFNEFEMKRLALVEELSQSKLSKNLNDRGRYLLYSLYRIAAGYGEKPLWSFVWFCLLTPAFAVVHLLSGLTIDGSFVVNYDVSLSSKGIANFFDAGFLSTLVKDYGTSLVFALYRLIPIGYLPSGGLQIAPMGADGLLWSFLNSVVLILLVTLTGVGLKRHFRRY